MIATCHCAYPAILLISLAVCGAAEGNDDDVASLILKSEPPGATVRIGDEAIGTTPLESHSIKAEGQTLTISLDGFVNRTVQLPFQLQGDIDFGTLRLAKHGTTITVWRVGSPHRKDVPPRELPKRLADDIRELGFEVQVESHSSAEFPERFRKAAADAGLPDVVMGDNYLPFREVQRNERLSALMKRTSGQWNLAEPFIFLIAGSKGEIAAQYVALMNEAVAYSGAIDEVKLKDLPGNLKPEFARQALERQNQAVAVAYITNRMAAIKPLLHKDILPIHGAHRDQPAGGIVAAVRPLYVLGNNRLAFVLSSVAFVREESVGCQVLLTVWSKPKDDWKLLIVTNDPISFNAAQSQIPALAQQLGGGMSEPLEPARILSPDDGVFTRPPIGKRFGDFVWAPSKSDKVVAELAEFNYEYATRLIFSPTGVVSTGQLWTTSGPWKWRVWSISKQGDITFSEVRNFRH